MPDDDNPFAALARDQMVAATKAKWRQHDKRQASKVKVYQRDSDAPLQPGEQEQAQIEQSAQYRRYRRWKRSQLKQQMLGPNRKNWLELARRLRKLAPEHNDDIVDYVINAQWLRDADKETRAMVLSAIANAIMRLRIRDGRDPIDDSLPGEPPTIFEIIRAKLKELE